MNPGDKKEESSNHLEKEEVVEDKIDNSCIQNPTERTEEGQEDESVVYFRERIAEVEKSLESLITRMQEDMESIFSNLASQVVDLVQTKMGELSESVEEIQYKSMERNKIASNLEEAENAVNTFYHSLENKGADSESMKE